MYHDVQVANDETYGSVLCVITLRQLIRTAEGTPWAFGTAATRQGIESMSSWMSSLGMASHASSTRYHSSSS